MKATLISLLFASSFAFAGVSWGQSYAIRSEVAAPSAIYHHASTLEEGYLRGRADVIRAWGDYNYNSSLAAINGQHAYSLKLDNDHKEVETYFERRRLNAEYRAAENGPKPTMADAVGYARERAPGRLSRYEYDATFGKLFWPALLQHEMFAQERGAIDALISARSVADGGTTAAEIRLLTSRLEAQLKGMIRELPPSDYVAAKSFLNRLEQEVQMTPAVDVAAN